MIGNTTTPRGVVLLSTQDFQVAVRTLLESIDLSAPQSSRECFPSVVWDYVVVGPCRCETDAQCQQFESLELHLPLPSVVLVDWKLPRDVLEQWLCEARSASVLVVALVPEHDARSVLDAQQSGVDQVVVWPATASDLSEVLLKILLPNDRRIAESTSQFAVDTSSYIEQVRFEKAGRMVAGISHEVHQPLYAIANFAGAAINTLRSKPLQDAVTKVIRWCEQIANQSHRAAELLQNLRRYATSDISLQAISPARLVDESIELVTGTHRELGILFDRNYPSVMPDVMMSRVWAQQVILQLLDNACESMRQVPLDERSVKVTIQSAGNQLTFVVTDTGTGGSESSIPTSDATLLRQVVALLGGSLEFEREPIDQSQTVSANPALPRFVSRAKFGLPCSTADALAFDQQNASLQAVVPARH